MRGDLVEPWEIVLSASIERTRRCKKGTKMKLDFKFKWFWSLTCARHADGLYLHILGGSSMSLCLGPRRSLELVVIGSSSHFCAMAKTLKFALSALALVNAHKPRDEVQEAYDQFLKDFGKSYDSIEKQVLEGLDGVQRGWGSVCQWWPWVVGGAISIEQIENINNKLDQFRTSPFIRNANADEEQNFWLCCNGSFECNDVEKH